MRLSLPVRIARFVDRIFRIRERYLQFKYRHNKTLVRFDIDWRATNYNRIAIVNLLLAHKPGSRYLEIGCDRNEAFDAVIAEDKIGVDPARGGTHRLTSDEFFQRNSGQQWDVVFIDGLHTYEQAGRDVRNALRHIHRDGWIVLHDMYPRDWLEEHVPSITSGAWTGDVWKLAFELSQSKDIEFRLLKIDLGVGVIRVRNQNAIVPNLAQELAEKRFSYFHKHVGLLPVVNYTAGRKWIVDSLSR